MPLDPLARLEILINCLRPVLHLGRITLFCLFGHIIIAVASFPYAYSSRLHRFDQALPRGTQR